MVDVLYDYISADGYGYAENNAEDGAVREEAFEKGRFFISENVE